MNTADWQQLIIVHVSDIHFGRNHRFDPLPGDDGQRGPRLGIPSLSESLLADLARDPRPDLVSTGRSGHSPIRVIFALTGDFTETGEEAEYDEAREFLAALRNREVFGWKIGSRDLFLIPGNHDVRYTANHSADRWIGYCRFYHDHLTAAHEEETQTALTRGEAPSRQPVRFDERRPHLLSRIVDQSKDGLIVAEINSSAYVKKGEPGERRGEIDQLSIANLDEGMTEIANSIRMRAIKVALIHHHPVLLPGLAEAGRGNDAVGSGEMLLNLLRDQEFQVVLHGHKHVPYTFLYDAELAWATDRVRPIMIVAGGSAGSRGLPSTDGAKNTYNIISIKWHAGSGQVRLRTETRGLLLRDDRNQDLPAAKWEWKSLAVDDRVLTRPRARSNAADAGIPRLRDNSDAVFDAERAKTIRDLKRNFPCIEVIPSFHPDQGYEARVWIDAQDKEGYEPPVRVEWSGGPFFPQVTTVQGSDDPKFHARFSYYGPALIQARIYWKDKSCSLAYVFAHYPK